MVLAVAHPRASTSSYQLSLFAVSFMYVGGHETKRIPGLVREALSRGPEPGARRSAVVGKWASAIGRLSHRHVVRNALS